MKYLNKTIEYGLYLLVFILPMQTRWIIKAGELNGGPWEYGTYSLYATDILLIIVLLLFFVRAVCSWIPAGVYPPKWRAGMTKKEITSSPPPAGEASRNYSIIWWLIGGLLLMSAVSVFFAASKPLALYKLGWLILGIGFFGLVISANYNRLKLIYAMLAGFFLQAILGVWQFLTQSSFANKWLGVALHKSADLGTSVIEAVGADGVGERWLRAYGGLDHPNMLGGILAVGVLLLIGKMIKFNKFSIFNNQFSNNFQFSITNFQTNDNTKVIKIISWAFLAIFFMALFFSFSRAAWLGLAIGLGVILVSAVAGRNYKIQKGLAQIILVMGILLFMLFSQYQNLIISRLGGEGRLENKSTTERLASYQESGQLIKNNWATGVGLGNYTYELSRQAPGEKSFYYQPTHNVYLLILSEIGVLGFIFYVCLILYLLIFNLKLKILNCFKIKNFKLKIGDNSEGDNSIINLSILMVLVVLFSLDHWLWSLHFGVLFFWLVLGLIVSEKEKRLNPPGPL